MRVIGISWGHGGTQNYWGQALEAAEWGGFSGVCPGVGGRESVSVPGGLAPRACWPELEPQPCKSAAPLQWWRARESLGGGQGQCGAGRRSWRQWSRPAGLSTHLERREGVTWPDHSWGERGGPGPKAQAEKRLFWHLIGLRGITCTRAWGKFGFGIVALGTLSLCWAGRETAGHPFFWMASLSWSLCNAGPGKDICFWVALFSAR